MLRAFAAGRLRAALRGIGERIAVEGTPPALGPFVVGLTGCVIRRLVFFFGSRLIILRNGNVSQGCLSILSELPIVNVSVKDLHNLVTNPS